jgi:hypothetical protein
VNQWTPSGPPAHVWGLAAAPDAPSTLYAGTLNGVYRSVDQGQTWTLINTDFAGLEIHPV